MRVTNDMFVAEFLCIVLVTLMCVFVGISVIDPDNANVWCSAFHVKCNSSIANKIEEFIAACLLLHALPMLLIDAIVLPNVVAVFYAVSVLRLLLIFFFFFFQIVVRVFFRF